MSSPKAVRALFTDFKVFSGTANPALTQEICEYLGCPLGEMMIKKFADGETHLQIQENVRGSDVFLVQPTCTPVDHHLIELLLLIDAFKRASAERITAVLPYYGYARQDRKDRPRMPISAKLVASLIERAGASRVLALDLHAAQIQDAGGVERARAFAKRINAPLAIIDKRRTDTNVAEVMNIIGQVGGMHCLMVDDLVDTAGTLVNGTDALLEQGALSVTAFATHAVLSGKAVERISGSALKELVVTNSIPLSPHAGKCGKIRVLSVASLLARAIQSIHQGGSVSTLFIS
jgi:ribose-phosphate pyrophosphokinase